MRITKLTDHDLVQNLIGHAFGSSTHHVVTANAQFYVLAEKSVEFRSCINEAEYVCPDGISVVMACKWLGRSSVARIAGVDLIDPLCREASSLGLPVFFLGGRPGSASETASLLMDRYPGLVVAGVVCPPTGFLEDERVLKEIVQCVEEARPAIVFVGLGAPLQEFFIQRHIRPLRVPVAVGVGGSFEILCGRVRRAPRWVRRIGMEWLFRWSQEPRRLARRYVFGNLLFAYFLSRRLLHDRGLEGAVAAGRR
jgi:N-acetylglucosaminyldiphosphoundecaprenol N-acetyl-beta-D-mannosaminyltransferase